MSVSDLSRKKRFFTFTGALTLGILFVFSGPGMSEAFSAKRNIGGHSSGGFHKSFSRNSGLKRGSRSHNFRLNKFNNHGFGNRNFGSVRSARSSGVMLGKPLNVGAGRRHHNIRRNDFQGGFHGRNSGRNSGVIFNSARNNTFRNSIHASRSGVVPHRRHSGDFRNDLAGALIYTIPQYGNNGSADNQDYTQSCPKYHNCGFRLYTDGTGPRIIQIQPNEVVGERPGVEYNTPQIITLDDIQ